MGKINPCLFKNGSPSKNPTDTPTMIPNRIPRPSTRRQLLLSAGAASLALAVPTLRAQPAAFPSRPVRILVGFTPGGQPDIFSRLIGGKLGEALGQPVVVDNRPGAGGNIGAEIAAKAPADGHTVLIGASGLGVGFIAAANAGSLWQFALAQGLLIGMLGTSAGFAAQALLVAPALSR